jgi:histidinol-phosphate aminotransferase
MIDNRLAATNGHRMAENGSATHLGEFPQRNGKQKTASPAKTGGLLKLSSNENPLGPSPCAMAILQETLTQLSRYPGEEEATLLQKLALRLGNGLTESELIVGNGSADVLRMMTHTFLPSGAKAVIAGPTFALYETLVQMFGGQPVIVPLRNYTVDLQRVLDAIDERVRLVFICNPNNPTGTMVTHQDVGAFLAQVPPQVTVVLDEAYMEFANHPDFPRMTEYIQAGCNVLVTRTFSKLHGLAGLRIGYGFGRSELIAQVRRHQMPFNTSRPAYLAATAALDDETHLTRTLTMSQEGRAYYARLLPALGFDYLPTHSNFIFLPKLPCTAAHLCAVALQQGVMLRRTDSFKLPDNVRITIARAHENARVIEILQEICA